MTRGVMQCLDQVPRVGALLQMQVDDLRLRSSRVSLVAVGPEAGLRPEFVAVRINLVAAPTSRGLRELLTVMAPGHEARIADDDRPLEAGLLLALDPSTGVIGGLRDASPQPAARRSTPRAVSNEPQRPRRRVIEISSRKGARPRPTRDSESD
jgi:hypothetical protein